MIKSVGILGCGWLGMPLATALLEAGYKVHGTTTSDEKLPVLSAAGIKAFPVRLEATRIEGDIAGFLNGPDVLIINVPPGIRSGTGKNYVGKIQQLHAAVRGSGCGRLVFVSSTSVYGLSAGEITEKSPPGPKSPSGTQLLEAEQVFMSDGTLQTIVVRFGGLIGPDRHPVTFLSGRKNLENGNELVNLIHQDDAVAMVKNVMEGGYWGQVFNGVAPQHPAKREYYTREALKRGLPPPEYSDSKGIQRKISSANYRAKGHYFLSSIYSP